MIGARVSPQEQRRNIERTVLRRYVRMPHGAAVYDTFSVPQTTILCHGDAGKGEDRSFIERLRACAAPVGSVRFVESAQAVQAARDEMEIRGDRYLAIVDTACTLAPGWLDELIAHLEAAPTIGAASYRCDVPGAVQRGAYTADAGCTLLALSKFPQHLRLKDFDTLCGSLADFLIRCLDVRAAVVPVPAKSSSLPQTPADASFEAIHQMPLALAVQGGPELIEQRLRRPGRCARGALTSIVMLSWNAPQFTKLALESIRANTSGDYEIIIVDNGSKPETVDWLKTLHDVRVIYNAENRGYAGGNNQGITAARGDYVVLLNNDVIVTEGWLEGLLDAFDRIPGLGVSAPRSNKIAGNQIVQDAEYADIAQMHDYAKSRRERLHNRGFSTDRAIGLCLCVDRRVIREIGGIDERFGVGNYEDDDFCLRVRAAGYRIYVCDDVFIHHFGSQTFAANNVDWSATMRENWEKFARKWELPPLQENGGYIPAPAIARGFDRARHYVALPRCEEGLFPREYLAVFTAVVGDEREWNDVAFFARRYLRAFRADQPVLLAIAASGAIPAQTLGSRLHRMAQREGLDDAHTPDVDVCDAQPLEHWEAELPATSRIRFDSLNDSSPSALKRCLREYEHA